MKFIFEPDSQNIDMAGERGFRFLKSKGFSDDSIKRPVMILRELIKNGKKYCSSAAADYEIAVCIHSRENAFTIEVRNPVDEACHDRLQELEKSIQFINGYQDPFEPYAMSLGDNSTDDLNSQSYDSALAEIAYKGKAHLDFFITEDNILNMTAVGNLIGDTKI